MIINVYHGSKNIVKTPIYGKGKTKNDYGQGFYMTKDIELAKEWSVVDDYNDGYVNKYSLDLSNLKILNLSNKKYSTLHWITLLLENRTFALKNNIAKAGKDFLIKNYHINTDGYDVIVGYRADDSYFTYADNFLNNSISLQTLQKALKLGNLGMQVVLKSKKAFNQIKFVDYEKVDAYTYFQLRRLRNTTARKYYFKLSDNEDVYNTFISDIIKGNYESI